MREIWEVAARRANPPPEAIEALDVPAFPDCVAYLWRWTIELVGRSGSGMAGAAPLSHEEIRAWAGLTGQHPTPREVGALMKLDRTMRGLGPGSTEQKKKGPHVDPPWPGKKVTPDA